MTLAAKSETSGLKHHGRAPGMAVLAEAIIHTGDGGTEHLNKRSINHSERASGGEALAREIIHASVNYRYETKGKRERTFSILATDARSKTVGERSWSVYERTVLAVQGNLLILATATAAA